MFTRVSCLLFVLSPRGFVHGRPAILTRLCHVSILRFCRIAYVLSVIVLHSLTEAANYGNIKIFILPFFGVIAYVLSAVVVSKSPSYVSVVWLTFCKLWFLTFTETASCCGNVKIFILRFRRMADVFLCVEVSNFFILRF